MGRGTAAHTLETADSGATIGSRTRGEGLLLREKRGRVEKTESESDNSPSRIHKHSTVTVKWLVRDPYKGGVIVIKRISLVILTFLFILSI